MHNTPSSNRLHIGIFGKRNAGKSSLINAITGQKLAIVSEIPGTTTDPVYKSIEILPLGPCILIDTAGLDDKGTLGKERIRQTLKVLRKTEFGIIVVDAKSKITSFEENIIRTLKEKKLPFIVAINKSDKKNKSEAKKSAKEKGLPYIEVSSKTGKGILLLKNKIIELAPSNWAPVPLVSDFIKKNDTVVLVCPIDSAMPQGRLILPQVQVLRDILDKGGIGLVSKDLELKALLKSLKNPPSLVITDSQVFEDISRIVPKSVPLTSFSIIYARHRGDINEYMKGVKAIEKLKDGDGILIAESCTHHPQPEDIARSKIPSWLFKKTKKHLNYDIFAGGDFPENLSKYKLIITCGGCMVNRTEIFSRIEKAKKSGVPITNYGILIAHLNGILKRVVAPLKKGKVNIE